MGRTPPAGQVSSRPERARADSAAEIGAMAAGVLVVGGRRQRSTFFFLLPVFTRRKTETVATWRAVLSGAAKSATKEAVASRGRRSSFSLVTASNCAMACPTRAQAIRSSVHNLMLTLMLLPQPQRCHSNAVVQHPRRQCCNHHCLR